MNVDCFTIEMASLGRRIMLTGEDTAPALTAPAPDKPIPTEGGGLFMPAEIFGTPTGPIPGNPVLVTGMPLLRPHISPALFPEGILWGAVQSAAFGKFMRGDPADVTDKPGFCKPRPATILLYRNRCSSAASGLIETPMRCASLFSSKGRSTVVYMENRYQHASTSMWMYVLLPKKKYRVAAAFMAADGDIEGLICGLFAPCNAVIAEVAGRIPTPDDSMFGIPKPLPCAG